jgi:superfamily II helicase
MHLKEIKEKINNDLYSVLESKNIDELRPCQEKSINAGLLDYKY